MNQQEQGNLSVEERQRTIESLRREAEAKLLHAEALQAETDFFIETRELSSEEQAPELP
jgi:hypothetical protein